MTLRDMQNMINEAIRKNPEDIDCEVVMTSCKEPPLPGMFAFEGVCPGVSGIIELGPAPDLLLESEQGQENTRVFLIAPHSMHGDDDHEVEKQKALN